MVAPVLPQGNCPHCGASRGFDDSPCWLCGCLPSSPANRGSPFVQPAVVVPAALPSAAQPFQFSIGGLFVLITVIAVCLGALKIAPGLGVLLIVIALVSAVPAAIRESVIARQWPGRGSFWQSFFISAAAITVGLIACGISAIVAVAVGCGGARSLGQGLSNTLAMVLLFGSPVVGLLIAGFIYWQAWPRKQ